MSFEKTIRLDIETEMKILNNPKESQFEYQLDMGDMCFSIKQSNN